MADYTFPTNPNNGDTVTVTDITYTWVAPSGGTPGYWENNVIGMASSAITIAADSGSNDDVIIGTDTLTFSGDTGITTTVSNNSISIDLDDTAASAGSYGSASLIPSITVDAQGRITSISNVTSDPDGKLTVTTDTSTNSAHYVTFATGTTGAVSLKTSSALKFNPSTGSIEATNLQGSFIGNVEGNLVGNVTGNVVGNITGTVSGGASVASNVLVAANEAADENLYLLMSDGISTEEAVEANSTLRFNPSTDSLTLGNLNTTGGL